jgi:predicted ArsR family transcriptional regulator
MADTRWNQRFFQSTRGRVVALLRRGNQTVEELARALGLTDNAVRAHLATLERDGIVRQEGVRRGLGKPAYGYELTAAADQLFPKPYGLALRQTLAALAERLPPDELEDLLRAVGRRMAADLPAAGGDLRTRAAAAVAALNELGGLAELEERDDALVIRGYSCPLAAIVPSQPAVCLLAESLLADLVGAPVSAWCERGDSPRCCFAIADSAPTSAPPADSD